MEEQFRQKDNWGTPGSYLAKWRDSMRQVNEVLADTSINPSRKSLTPTQYEDFQRVVDDWAKRVGAAHEHTWGLRREAMMRSSRTGRFDAMASVGNNVDAMTLTPAEGYSLMERARAAQEAQKSRLLERLGVGMRDLRFTSIGTSEPDGQGRDILVYFTKDQEPAFFIAEADLERLSAERRAAFKAYLENLR